MSAPDANQNQAPQRRWRRAGAWLGWGAFAGLVLTASYLTAGRLLLPRVAGETERIQEQLSQLLRVPVRIEGLEGRWQHFTPWLEVGALLLQAPDGSEHRIENLSVALDVWPSLRQQRLVISSLAIGAVELVVEQQADGRWALAGLPPGQGRYTEQIKEFLLQTPHMSLSESRLIVRPFDGPELTLHSIHAEIQNNGRQHRGQLQFRLDEQPQPSRLSLELSERDDTRFSGRGWATLPQLDLQMLLQYWLSDWQIDAAFVDAEVWFDFDETGAGSFMGRVRDAQLMAQESQRELNIPLADGAVDLQGERFSGGEWTLDLSRLRFAWNQQSWDVPRLQLSRPDPEAPTLLLQAERLDLAMLANIALDAAPLPASGENALRTLQPQGALRHVHLETRSDGSYPGFFQLRANVEDGAVQAWNMVPGGSNLSAYVEASALNGVAEVDSRELSLHLPRVFDQAWHYDAVNGRVSWQVADGEVRVQSDLIDVQSPDLTGRVGFAVRDRLLEEGVHENTFKLLVGVDRMAVAPGRDYLPKLPRLQNAMNWLRGALRGGEISDSGFVLRMQRKAGQEVSTAVQSWYQVRDGQLRYLDDWPLLENAVATVTVRDDEVDVRGRAGSIDGVALGPVTARVRSEEDGGSWLTILGGADMDTATGHRFLMSTPIHDLIGSTFDDWQASGQLSTALSLGIPLGDNPRERVIDVAVLSRDSTLFIPDYSLEFSEVKGLVRYREAVGLTTDKLTASLFGETVNANINSTKTDTESRLTRVTGLGHVSVDALRNWERMPGFVGRLLGHAEGELDYELTLDVPGESGAARLRLSSNLIGMTSNLPAPFAKDAEEQRYLDIDYNFGSVADAGRGVRGDLLTLRFDDFVSGELVLDDRGINRGQIYAGVRNRDFVVRQVDRSTSALLVSGELPLLDVDAWNKVATTLRSDEPGGRTLKESVRLVDLNVADLIVFGTHFANINVQVQPDFAGWRIQGSNEMIGGRFLLADSGPWNIDLDYLRFPPRPERTPEEAKAEEEMDILEAVDPTALPAFDFATAEFSIGESNLGGVSFQFRPHRAGAYIRNFHLQSPQNEVLGFAEGTGADIDWNYSNGRHQSHFRGLVTATDLGQVLPAWGHAAFLQSRNARFEADLTWAASPLGFRLKRSTGDVNMSINDGRFAEISSGSSRLLGAFNFDAVVRRLQLDFSDLFQRGFTYDSITGQLVFRDGVITTNNTLVIDGPSSRIRIDGEINLPDETIAADMLVRIPLSQNITMLAGLLGAWPIAVSTYVASKIFAEQVGEFTTLAYRLEGPWNNVQAGFDAPTPAEESSASELPVDDDAPAAATDELRGGTESSTPTSDPAAAADSVSENGTELPAQ